MILLEWSEFALAARTLRRTPTFALTSVLVLSIGVAAATAMFSIGYTQLLRPLPVRAPQELVTLTGQSPGAREPVPLPFADLAALQRYPGWNAEVAAIDYTGAYPRVIRLGNNASNVNTVFVSGNLFEVLGASAALGRALRAADDQIGAPPVVVVSHALWMRLFSGSPDVIGQRLVVNGQSAEVVGVMPREFAITTGTELWAPILPLTAGPSGSTWVFAEFLARVPQGGSAEDVAARFTQFLSRDGAEYPVALRGLRALSEPLARRLQGEARTTLLALAGGVGLLLLLTLVNVANLFVARFAERRQEFVVRAALGASTPRIIRTAVQEAALVSAAATLLGVAIAWLVVRTLVLSSLLVLPAPEGLQLEWRAVVFAGVLGVFTVACVGVGTAVSMRKGVFGAGLMLSTRTTTEGRHSHQLRQGLIVAQVALSTVIVVGAGLLTRTVLHLQSLDRGYRANGLLLAQFESPGEAHPTLDSYLDAVDALTSRIVAIPGVTGATTVLTPPFLGAVGIDAPARTEGVTDNPTIKDPLVNLESIDPRYLQTMAIPLLQGRSLGVDDTEQSPPVVVVNLTAARTLWPDGNVLGKRIRVGSDSSASWRTVVGVIADTKYRDFTDVRSTVFLPMRQFSFGAPTYLVVRSTGDPGGLAEVIRRVAGEVVPGTTFPAIQSFAALESKPLARPRLLAVLMATFGATCTLLAAVGLYGLLTLLVRQRGRDLSIRMALGAGPQRLVQMIVGQGIGLAMFGLFLGSVVALGLTQLAQSLLFGVATADPVTYGVVIALMTLVTVLACYVPARRAAASDPALALRAE